MRKLDPRVDGAHPVPPLHTQPGITAEVRELVQTLFFEGFELDLDRRELRRGQQPVDLDPKPLALLIYLAQNRERSVPKEELLRNVWPDVFVSEAALSSALKDLRRALGDDGTRQQVIRTQRRRGYRFVARARIRRTRLALASQDDAPDLPPVRFVGRREELSWLSQLAAAVAAGSPRIALVAGEAGTGKSSLFHEFASQVEPLVLAEGRCPQGASVPYQPFIEALSSWLPQCDEDAEGGGSEDELALLRLLQLGTESRRSPEGRGLQDPLRDRLEFFGTVSRMLVRLARRHPTLLWIDDLQWADPATLQLFTHIGTALLDAEGSCPLLLAATFRPPDGADPLSDILGDLATESRCERRRLGGLAEEEIDALLEHLDGAPPERDVVRELVAATGGNPLFVRELWREAQETEVELAQILEGTGPPLPADALEMLTKRVDALPDACRDVLRVASLIGEQFGRIALAAGTGVEESKLAPLLTRAIGSGLLVAEGRVYRFSHPLVRQVLRSDLDDRERSRIHRRIADVLEDLYAGAGGDHAMEIAHHLLLTEVDVDPLRKLRLARRAGDQAFALCAWQAAARYYDAAVTAGTDLPLAERAALHLRAGVSANHALDPACVLHYERAADAFEHVGDVVGLAWARMYLARARFTLGPVATSGDDLKALEGLADRVADAHPVLRGLLLETIGEAHWAAGDLDAAAFHTERALELGRELDDDATCHHAAMGLALARFSRLEVREAVDGWREALGHAKRLRDPWLESAPNARLTMGLVMLGRLDEAGHAVRTTEEAARRVRNYSDLSLVHAQAAVLSLAKGEFTAVDREAAEARRCAARARYPWALPFAIASEASALALRASWADASAALDELVEPGRLFATPPPEVQLMVAAYRHLLEAERDPSGIDRAALSQYPSFVRLAGRDARVLSPLCALVDLAALAGDPVLADAASGTLQLAVQRGVLVAQGWVFFIPRLLAQAARLSGRVDEACTRYGNAVRIARDLGMLPELARTLLGAADAWAARGAAGDRGRADKALAEARNLCGDLGVSPSQLDRWSGPKPSGRKPCDSPTPRRRN